MKYLRKFENNAAYESATLDLPNVAYCEEENEVHYNPIPDYSKEYLTFVAKESGTFTFSPRNSNVISYSTDGGETWTEGSSVEVSNGDKVLWKGTMTPQNYYGSGTFSSTANFDVQGNAMSLLFNDNFKEQTNLTGKDYAFGSLFSQNTKIVNAKNLSLPATTLASYCYTSMFSNCTNLVTAPELPATTLTNYCYNAMFYGCTNLETAPDLPATTLAERCYSHMFHGCTSLTTAPTLPATTLAENCYEFMFSDCTSLTTAPELSATTLVDGCYIGIFYGCTNLTTVPELPATTLAIGCYGSMFNNCTSLTIAPVLPATTLVTRCYVNMFKGCISLETAPDLSATTLVNNCYSFMFQDCSNLNYIKAMFTTTPSTDYTNNWVNGVAATGTFVKNSAAQWDVSGVDGIPTGWTVQTASE